MKNTLKASIRPIFLLLSIASIAGAQANTLSNSDFCRQGLDSLAELMSAKVKTVQAPRIIVSQIEGRFGESLQGSLAAALMRHGAMTYLMPAEAGEANKFLLQSTIHDYSLMYVGVNGGLFRQGDVSREFTMSADARLLTPDGGLLQSLEGITVMVSDTLSFDEARRARGNDSILSPRMPSTLFQKLVEPGIVVGITGALVYLFFASR